MKNMQLFEIFDGIDDSYIEDAQIAPAGRTVALGASHTSRIIGSIASVAAIVLVLGVIFVWSIVGKDVLKAQNSDKTTQSTTPSQSVTTPLNQIITTPSDTLITTDPQITTPQNTTTGEHFDPGITMSDLVVPADGIIKNENDLHAVLVKGKSNGNYTVTAKELDMSGRFWYGMADFSGTFDFGGCKLKNVHYSLFKSVKDGTVKNLVLTQSEYSHFSSNDNFKYGDAYFSPIVCNALDITVSNIIVESSVVIYANIENNTATVGGIVGLARGNNIRIENCEFHGEISLTSSGPSNLGGIVGEIMASDHITPDTLNLESSPTCVIGCVNTGEVISLGRNWATRGVGGISGRVDNCAIIRCSNSGKIFSETGEYIGGIAGLSAGSVAFNMCINSGEISGSQSYAGGIAGIASGKLQLFTNCVNLGSASLTNEYKNYAGGIAGTLEYDAGVINCFNLSNATATFAYNDNFPPKPIDLSDPSTFNNLDGYVITFDNCGNYATVEEIFDKINTASPDTFTLVNGSIKLK